MPVYLATVHSYRSWREDHPKGFIQHDDSWQPANPRLAAWRDDHAKQLPNFFPRERFSMLLDVAAEIAHEQIVRLHACSVTTTHVHQLVSFHEPECICQGAEHCHGDCPGRERVELVLTRYKRIAGCRLAKAADVRGRKWFSHGWNISPVRAREHFEYLVTTYLPKHEREGGLVRIVA